VLIEFDFKGVFFDMVILLAEKDMLLIFAEVSLLLLEIMSLVRMAAATIC
jgi:hypothetical protein